MCNFIDIEYLKIYMSVVSDKLFEIAGHDARAFYLYGVYSALVPVITDEDTRKHLYGLYLQIVDDYCLSDLTMNYDLTLPQNPCQHL